jgi:hypothetical protein
VRRADAKGAEVRSSGRRARRAWAALGALALVVSVPARADEPAAGAAAREGVEEAEPAEPPIGWGEKALDAALVRPLGAGATAVGFAFFVISVPLVAASGGIRDSWDLFVMGPFDYTFVRPLGEL